MNELRAIALTHKHFPLDTIGLFHIDPSKREEVLTQLKNQFGLAELMYLSTCNRVEIVFSLPHFVCPGQTASILSFLQPTLSEPVIREIAAKAERYNGNEAVTHLLRVASSLESLVIGEREIITQLRKSYEECAALNLTGDHLRIVIGQCIKTAKAIFTHTDLSKKPVSVVSLAWKEFLNFNPNKDARVLMIGAGQIIRNFGKFLFENGYTQLTIANRTLKNAEELTHTFGGNAIHLDELSAHTDGFDVLVSCTASENNVISAPLYNQLLQGDFHKKLIIDLAIPADIDASILSSHAVTYVGMKEIQQQAAANIEFREQALIECEPIIQNGMNELERSFNERKVEMAMRSIPEAIKGIKQTALGSVFAKDLEDLDENSREVLEKILAYMEKKYISVPMKMAREVLLEAVSRN